MNGTGNSAYQGFVLVASTKGPFTVAHELMHILLNETHIVARNNEPSTALFHSPTSSTNTVPATKRIGPYPDAAAVNVGNNDTGTIRPKAEALPQ